MKRWFKKFPLYKQLDQKDCGATCLRMISKYYGKEFPITEIRNKTFVSKEGASLLAISEAAEGIGFTCMGIKVSFEKLLSESPFPVIVHWNQKHFVVVYKITGRKSFGKNRRREYMVHVADPAGYLFKYTREEFTKGWYNSDAAAKKEGIALLLEPTDTFYSIDIRPVDLQGTSMRHLLAHLRGHRRLVATILLTLMTGCLFQLTLPFLTQAIVDKGIGSKDINIIYAILAGQLMLVAGMTTADFVRRTLLLRLSLQVNIGIISAFLRKLVQLPISFFDRKNVGDILKRIDDHSRIERFLSSTSLSIVFSFITVIVFGAVLAYYDFLIFSIFIVGSAVYGWFVTAFLNKRRKLDYSRFDQAALSQNNLIQLVHGMQEVKLNNCEDRKLSEWGTIQQTVSNLTFASSKLQQYQEAGAVLISEIKNILIIAVSAQAVIKGEISLGVMLSIQYIVGQLNSPINEFLRFTREYQDAKIALERIGEVHVLESEEPVGKWQSTASEYRGQSIIFKALDFQYEGPHSAKALSCVSVEIPRGKVTAIVGSSGSGKTTLLKLLLKFYKPTAGGIFVGEHDLATMDAAHWRSQCGVVMQDGKIFPDTIAGNVAMASQHLDEVKLWSAIRLANLEEFVRALPQSLYTRIPSDGSGLSQGQKQRILIARAIYKNPAYLFLDEATSALDTQNEKIIVKNLSSFFAERTVVVIAHRLSTVMNADQIVVIEKGKITEIGTHPMLIDKRGQYFELVRNQLNIPA